MGCGGEGRSLPNNGRLRQCAGFAEQRGQQQHRPMRGCRARRRSVEHRWRCGPNERSPRPSPSLPPSAVRQRPDVRRAAGPDLPAGQGHRHRQHLPRRGAGHVQRQGVCVCVCVPLPCHICALLRSTPWPPPPRPLPALQAPLAAAPAAAAVAAQTHTQHARAHALNPPPACARAHQPNPPRRT